MVVKENDIFNPENTIAAHLQVKENILQLKNIVSIQLQIYIQIIVSNYNCTGKIFILKFSSKIY